MGCWDCGYVPCALTLSGEFGLGMGGLRDLAAAAAAGFYSTLCGTGRDGQ